MLNSARNTLLALILILFGTIAITSSGCAQPRGSERETESRREREEGEREEEEHEGAKRPPAPIPWGGGGMVLEPVEGKTDTIRFHIGSPLFLRLKINGDRACAPFGGQPFYFDAVGSQLGWGLEEVADSLLFPRKPGSCERIVMLSSEHSNRVAEGYYTMKVMIFLDPKDRLYSDTIVLHAVRSAEGADEVSYARFLQEQIARNSSLLRDAETIGALFAEGTPRSAESEVYHALILLRGGDIPGAERALENATGLAARRGKPLSMAARAVQEELRRLLTGLRSGR